MLDFEERSEVFSGVPFHYEEIAILLLENAADDLPDKKDIRRLLQDLSHKRTSKIR
jgi:GINS complex subunit 2